MHDVRSRPASWIVPAIAFVLSCASGYASAQVDKAAGETAVAAHLETLLEAGEYFGLRAELEDAGSKMLPVQHAYFRPFVQSAFNRYPDAIAGIESVLQTSDPFLWHRCPGGS
jgi:predicted secreted hydrolase